MSTEVRDILVNNLIKSFNEIVDKFYSTDMDKPITKLMLKEHLDIQFSLHALLMGKLIMDAVEEERKLNEKTFEKYVNLAKT